MSLLRVVLACAFVSLLVACGDDPAPAVDGGADSGGDGGGAGCASDEDCDDGVFCNGVERCGAGGECGPGASPCEGDETCDEAADRCVDPCAAGGDADDDGRRSVACGGDDCDDGDPNRFPGNPEVCDALDHDEDCDAETFGVRDSDSDTYVDARCCNVDDTGARHCGDDCDDARASSSPVADESCNSLDDDCDGSVDEEQLVAFYPDADGDGYGAEDGTPMLACMAPDGHVQDRTDCDDTQQLRNPATSELCDGIDNNCDGTADEAGMRTLYRDLDGDGHGDPALTMSRLDCEVPAGWVAVGDDCDDAEATTYTGAPELCDRVDQDCSLAGAAAGGVDPSEDADQDGHAPVGASCTGLPADDCDDARASVHGGAPELCDDLDNDCDGSVDPQPTVDAWCGPGAACDVGACEDRRTLAISMSSHACSIEASGALYCWGSDDRGQRGDGATPDPGGAALVTGISGMRSIALGRQHSCAVQADRTLACWGGEEYFTTSSAGSRTEPGAAWPSITEVAGVETRSLHSCVRLRNGTVRCWGSNEYGQIGDGTLDYRATPTPVAGLADAVALGVGSGHTCVRRRDSSVACWGDDYSGQLGRGATPGDATRLAPVVGLTGVRQLDVAAEHNCVLTAASEVWCWGRNDEGQIDGTAGLPVSTPRRVDPGCTVTQIDVTDQATCALCDTGRVRCWGSGSAIGDGWYATLARGPSEVPGLTDVVAIAGSGRNVCARTAGGEIACWGRPTSGVLGDGGALFARPVPGLGGVTHLAAGWTSTCAIASGQLYCWGRDDDFGIGSAASDDYFAMPAAIAGMDQASDVSISDDHICVVRGAGELYCWGASGAGQLGDGTSTSYAAPHRVPGTGVVTDVGTGEGHTCAREDDGTIRCWGTGSAGQLGNGVSSSSRSPVVAMITAGSVHVGQNHACVPTAGGVACWGSGSAGQLGRGTTSSSAMPDAVLGLASAPALLALGWLHACALDGSDLWCWGGNSHGQLGDGTTTNRSTPVHGPALAGVSALSAGWRHTCAIVAGGEVRCWGIGEALGDGLGGTTGRGPVAVSGVTGATALAGGRQHTCAIVGAGGEVWCWGRDEEGQLGRGALVRVLGLP